MTQRKTNRSELIRICRDTLEHFGDGRVAASGGEPWELCAFCGAMDGWPGDTEIRHEHWCLYGRLSRATEQDMPSAREAFLTTRDARRELQAEIKDLLEYDSLTGKGLEKLRRLQTQMRRLRVPRDRRHNPAL